MDLTKIPEFHPRVFKVDLIDGRTFREAGVSYQCHLSGGKHTCIEKDIEIVPLEKIVTVMPQDTFGISKVLIINEGGNQPLLLDVYAEGQASQSCRTGEDRSRDSGHPNSD